ncbi:S-layer homology domain-containing protein [Alteribacillus persepolensis]|uniref:S-layer homology domain-containing protein n=1 Tax=Alteribacillus persepolensis TaxID=568899 RepID=A0A1G8EVX3_9BACI|nr:S-layer homology domain-containing protein [Alteribacillus persepolensis]SDH74018.1 S-layer homology domain-containing protein [Alteribacillus persepolensis]
MKKLISTLMAAGVLAVPATASAASFSDVAEDFWAKDEIEELAEQGVMGGYPDGTFRPNKPVLRIQAASMLVNALGLERQDTKTPDFKDLPDDFHDMDVVDIMDETGILRGSNGHFRPYEPLTRAQMATLMNRALDLEENKDYFFTDIQPYYWNFADISALANSGITGGKGDGTFAPSESTSRAQFVTFLHRALDEDAERTPPEPIAGDYGKYVVKDGLTYGAEGDKLVAYERQNGDFKQVASYTKEGGTFNDAMQVVGDSIYVSVHESGKDNLYSFQEGTFALVQENAPQHWYFINDTMYYIMDSFIYKKNDQTEEFVDSINGEEVAGFIGTKLVNGRSYEDLTGHGTGLIFLDAYHDLTVFNGRIVYTTDNKYRAVKPRFMSDALKEGQFDSTSDTTFEESVEGLTIRSADGEILGFLER